MHLFHPRRALSRPRAWLTGLLLATVLLVPLAARLRLEGNVVDLLPKSSPAAQSFAAFTRGLVAGQELVILVVCAEPERLRDFADRYAAALAGLPDARQVTYRVSQGSLTYLREHLLLLLNQTELEELGRRVQPEALRRQVRRLRGLLSAPGGGALAPLLTADPLELVPLISRRLSSGLPIDAQSGYFRTADGKALLIKVRPGYDPMDWARDQRLLDDAGRLARQLGGEVAGLRVPEAPAAPTVAFTGSYAYPPYYRVWLEQDLALSTTISIGAVLLLFALFFRAVRILPWVMLPLACAGVWTAAAATLLFGRINGVSVAFGTILVAIGIDLPIQLYNRLREELLADPEAPMEAVRRTLDALTGPAVVATLGPAAVFFCCGLSDYPGLGELGLLAGVGLCLNCLAMLTLFPCLLSVVPLRWWHGPRASAADRARSAARSGGVLVRIGRLATRRPRTILLLCLVALGCALPFALRLSFDRRLFALEPRQMPPAVAQDEIARRFGERQRFLAAVLEDPDPDRALWRGDLWLQAAERLRQAGQLRGYEGLGTLVPSPRTQAERREVLRRLDAPGIAARLEKVLDEEGFDVQPFAGFLALLRRDPPPLTMAGLEQTELGFLVRTHVSDRPAEAGKPARRLLATYLFAPSDEPIEAVVAALREVARTEAGGALTGLPLLEQELLTIIERDTIKVTLSSLALITLLLIAYYRRWRPVVAVLVPLSLAWTLFAALLVILRMPLNLYNLLAIPLCIGYGIDDHIFLVHRHQAAPPAERDAAETLRTTGRAIVLTSLSTIAGFAGLLVAHFEGLLLLGLSGALAVLLCLLSAFAVLPALLRLLWPRQG